MSDQVDDERNNEGERPDTARQQTAVERGIVAGLAVVVLVSTLLVAAMGLIPLGLGAGILVAELLLFAWLFVQRRR